MRPTQPTATVGDDPLEVWVKAKQSFDELRH
jgi:hypothetical protein